MADQNDYNSSPRPYQSQVRGGSEKYETDPYVPTRRGSSSGLCSCCSR